jgi:PPOX class probable F420-dependent enzyme
VIDMAKGIDDALVGWLRTRQQAVLVTIRGDGSPQTSNVVFAVDEDGSGARVSVTETRAKAVNLRRDPRGVLHVLGEDFSSYASITFRATLGPTSTVAGDEAGRDLLAYYEQVFGAPHQDPAAFFAGQVAGGRLLLRLHFDSAVSWGTHG